MELQISVPGFQYPIELRGRELLVPQIVTICNGTQFEQQRELILHSKLIAKFKIAILNQDLDTVLKLITDYGLY